MTYPDHVIQAAAIVLVVLGVALGGIQVLNVFTHAPTSAPLGIAALVMVIGGLILYSVDKQRA